MKNKISKTTIKGYIDGLIVWMLILFVMSVAIQITNPVFNVIGPLVFLGLLILFIVIGFLI